MRVENDEHSTLKKFLLATMHRHLAQLQITPADNFDWATDKKQIQGIWQDTDGPLITTSTICADRSDHLEA